MRTKLSTRGQVTLPKAIRDKRRWRPGLELEVEDRPEGVLLKASKKKKKGSIVDLAGILKYDGRPRTIEEMDAAVVAEVRRRHARGRY